MKLLRNPVTLLVAMALQACSTTQPHATIPQSEPATLDNPSSIAPQSFLLRGQIVVSDQVQSLIPCSSNRQYWLELSDSLRQQIQNIAHSPDQAMYGEVIGHLEIPSQTGFNGDYTARFIVDHINTLSAENPGQCSHPLRGTRAFGTEPFWAAAFTSHGLMFEEAGGKKETFKVARMNLSNTKRLFQLDQGTLEMTRAICNDSMSDNLYGWQSNLVIGDKSYQGCAIQGNGDSSLNWAGDYFASSTKSTGFSVRLTLKEDHSAITRYEYANGDPAIIEQGFWQQLNPQQIQVVMTQHQQQYLLSQRIFTRHQNQIQAKKEQVGNVVYPIADGGLVLFSEQSSQVQK